MLKRVLSVVLAIAMTASMFAVVDFQISAAAAPGTVNVRIPSSEYTTVSGPDVVTNTNYKELFDGQLGTACTLNSTQIQTPMIWTTSTPKTVTEYSISGWEQSGNTTHKNRFPASWTLSGSSDGGATWTVLDSRSVDMSAFIDKPYTGNYFTVANPTPCNRYKLKIDSIQPGAEQGGSCRFSEFFMFESKAAKAYDNTKIKPADIISKSTSKDLAFDGDENTKIEYYGTFSAADPFEITWKIDAPITATCYTIMSGDNSVDYRNRYFHTWTLSGSKDGSTWTQLDKQTDYIFEKANNRDYSWEIKTPGEYQYYKISSPQSRNDGGFQSSEIKLYYAVPSTDYTAAAAVDALIDALPLPADITTDDADQINAAREAFTALTDVQKGLVKKLGVLEAAEATLAQMQAQPLADEIIALIAAGRFPEARAAYDAASPAVRKLVTNYNLLLAHEGYFSTSFETDDGLTLLENAPDTGRTENITSETRIGIRGNVTSLVDAASIAGSGIIGHEGMQYLFDNDSSTKFLNAFADTGLVPSATNPVWVSFKLNQSKVVKVYSICSGNDASERDPVDWTFSGSTDGKTWTTLDTRTGESFYGRQQENLYSFNNTTAYQYYKINITKNVGSFMTQFSELRVGTDEGNIDVLGGLVKLEGDITATVVPDSITGSTTPNSNESRENLFDGNTSTKWFCSVSPSTATPAEVSFRIQEPAAVKTYSISSANDFAGRNPKSWTFQGSVNGTDWVALDTRSGQTFSAFFQEKVYTFDNTTAYSYYKLKITESSGEPSCQFSEFKIGTGPSDTTESSSMVVQRTGGPLDSWVNSKGAGWSGLKSLKVTGSHLGTVRARGTNIIYDNLEIHVTGSTKLSYMIFPAQARDNYYDFDHSSDFMAVDLLFSDGTYLSELGALDQNGNVVSAKAQGESKALYTMQWNNIIADVGRVAEGKTISKILVTYDRPSNPQGMAPFLTYFDDISIENKPDTVFEHPSDYVNILRGTNGSADFSRGAATPAVAVPNGSNFYVPVTNIQSSTHYKYQPGMGLSLAHIDITHLSTTAGTSYGSWQFMPNSSINPASATSTNISSSSRRAPFKHENETANAHYYGVTFDENANSPASGVKLEVAPAQHSMISRVTFPADSKYRNMIFGCDFANGGLTFNADQKSFTAYSDQVKSGSSRMYVYGEFSTEYSSAKVISTKQGIVNFPDGQNTVVLKVATSFISADQAKRNLELEIPAGDTFDSVLIKAQKAWDDILKVIEVEGASFDQLTTFYSNLYRTYLYPNLYSENTGTNESPAWKYASLNSSTLTTKDIKDGKVYVGGGFWDSYHTNWPAYSLFTPSKSGDMLNGMLQLYKETGWLSRWLNPGNIDTKTGTQGEAVLADAIQKGIVFDYATAYDAVMKSANAVPSNIVLGGRKDQGTYPFRGYISNTSTSNSLSDTDAVSWSMDNYIGDYAASQLAAALGKTDEAEYLRNRSLNYTQLYNGDVGGYFLYKNTSGAFANTTSFNPYMWMGNYTESNAINTSFTVPHDINGLANLLGGRDQLAKKLDDFLGADLKLNRTPTSHEMREAREVRIGLLAQNTQPSLQIPYLYDYAGQPHKTQKLVRDIMDRLYVGSSIGQGYLGDDDVGSLSGWYVFSALGLYPTAVGNPEYAIGSPLFTKATIHLENGKDLVINAPDNSKKNVYIQDVKLNGKNYNKTYLLHSDLLNGGTIDFVMGDTPSDWGTAADSAPASVTTGTEKTLPEHDLTSPFIQKRTELNPALDETMIATTNTTEKRKLVDDTSSTQTTLTGSNKVIYYYSPNPQQVSMYTLTSGTDAAKAPSAFTLYASADGKSWTQLDKRTGEVFKWSTYTRPFSVPEDKRAAYQYFKLEFNDARDVTLAEMELLGSDAYTAIIEAIGALPDQQTVTLADKRAIALAREKYGSLSSDDKAKVTNIGKLTGLEAKILVLSANEPKITGGFSTEVTSISQGYSLDRQNEIVFYGASNFRMWADMEIDLGEYKVQNHGFGGSTDKDLMNYADKILYPYNPALVFFQTGSNDYVDVPGANTDAEKVAICMAYKKTMFETFHEKLPNAKFVVMSGLLLPGRSQYLAITQQINSELKKLCDSVDYMYFVDASAMTYDGTKFDTSLFISDQIHLNHTGQLRWCNEYIRPQIAALVEEHDLYWLNTEDEAQPKAPAGVAGTAPSAQNGRNGKITGVSKDMEWRAEGATGYSACTGAEITGLASGTYLVRFKSANGKLPSEDATVTILGGAPTGLTGEAPSAIGAADGKIRGVSQAMEWRAEGATGYTACTGTEITGLTSGTYFVRYKADGTVPASADCSVVVPDIVEKSGDVNGDGKTDASDVVKLRDLIKNGGATGEQIAAGDLNDDGALTKEDVALLLSQLEIRPGDVSGDGKVNAVDIMSIRKILLGNTVTDGQLAAGDLDGNGKLDATDIMKLRKMLLEQA